MILTLTLNPALDRTIELSKTLERGEVQRLSAPPTDVAAGKGVNVTRTLRAAGVDSLAIVLADEADTYTEMLAASGTPVETVATGVRVRVNIAITEPDGTTTKLNEPGTPIDEVTRQRVEATILRVGARASWLLVAGSLPTGTDPAVVVQAIAAAKQANPDVKIAVDSSGPPLIAAVAAGGIDLIKPNDEELAELLEALGLDSDVFGDPAAAAQRIVDRGVSNVLLTLGGDGALSVNAEGAFSASPPPTVVRSTVGAGDSSLAGWLIGDTLGEGNEGRLARAVAYGSAAASLPGTGIPTPEQADPERVTVRVLTTPSSSSLHHTTKES